jgi:hypothetical protein
LPANGQHLVHARDGLFLLCQDTIVEDFAAELHSGLDLGTAKILHGLCGLAIASKVVSDGADR